MAIGRAKRRGWGRNRLDFGVRVVRKGRGLMGVDWGPVEVDLD